LNLYLQYLDKPLFLN